MKVKENLVIEIIEDRYTIYDPIEDKLISLNLSGSLIFEWILKNLKIEEMISKYTQIYDVDENKAREDIESLINELKKEGIIEDDKESSDSE
ncbi:MAG: PqqD family protein [candidate division WOR-3 bacterium]